MLKSLIETLRRFFRLRSTIISNDRIESELDIDACRTENDSIAYLLDKSSFFFQTHERPEFKDTLGIGSGEGT